MNLLVSRSFAYANTRKERERTRALWINVFLHIVYVCPLLVINYLQLLMRLILMWKNEDKINVKF